MPASNQSWQVGLMATGSTSASFTLPGTQGGTAASGGAGAARPATVYGGFKCDTAQTNFGYITAYDNATAASGTLLDSVAAAAANTLEGPPNDGIGLANGLTISCPTGVHGNVLVYYR